MAILTDELREEMIDFLKFNLNIPYDGVWAHYSEDGWDDEDWYEDFCYECGADSIQHGASKLVLFYSQFPQWVVKIPFCGEYTEDIDSFKEFEGANRHFPIETDNDYCAGEVYISKQAKLAGLEAMFAMTYFLFELAGTPIYVSEKVPNSRWSDPHWMDKDSSLDIAESIKSCRGSELDGSLDVEVIAYLVDEYGEEKTYELIDFIASYDITDLHSGNVGFSRDMKIKILDYSGFDS